MNRHIYLVLSLLLAAAASAAADETVARWIDADGTTHYGDVQFAPSHADLQSVGPANGMDVPVVQTGVPVSSGPSWSLINLPPKKNPIGWRSKGDGPNNGPINRRSH